MQNFHCEELPGGSGETSMGKFSVDDVEQEQDHSEGQEEESSYDEYESDHCTYDCSVTSGLDDDHHLQEASTPCSDTPAADATSLQADESTDTTWTDDKHSSYLDSIEATFVRKMYGKEYCSMDVCGHSSHSSIALEQDCVESHPFYLNMRKPYEQAIGLSPFRVLRRPWSSASSVVASPWIQHFKSKNGGLAKVQENGTKMEQSNLLVSRKRAALFDKPECKQSSRNLHSTAAGGFKILKCQQALCRIDMAMEEQYNTEQYRAHLDQRNQDNVYLDQQNQDKIQSDGTEEEEPMPLTGVFEAGEARKSKEVPETSISKEKQAKAMCSEMGLTATILAKELLLKKLNQVVPTFKDGDKEACEQSISPDEAMLSKKEHDICRPSGGSGAYVESSSSHSAEHENVSSGSGSKTWTWGTQGVRYCRGGAMSPVNCKF